MRNYVQDSRQTGDQVNGAVIMYNILGICWFLKSVAKYDKWRTYRGGPLYKFFYIKSFLVQTGGFELGLQENKLMTIIIMALTVITEQGKLHK
jgi:hypothetical protein